MATKVKKVVAGPLTGSKDDVAGVAFVADGNAVGAIKVTDLAGMSKELYEMLSEACPLAIRLMVHGMSQRIGDAYAGASKAENPLAYAVETIRDGIASLTAESPLWRAVTEGGFRVTLLARALARATGQTPEAAQSVIDHHSDLDDEGKPSDAGKAWLKVMRANEAIVAASAAIKLEDAKAAEAALVAKAAKGGDAAGLAGLFPQA